ncbi:anthranilate synthase component 1 [Stomatohabitans albus]|uniref:anthranilate synthase component 1 n=1 Tax=Stomatohabitans albus TaxID=3110766 RepID=UPI00300C8993
MESPPYTLTYPVAYHADGGAILATLAAQRVIATIDGRPADAVLLDSADIDARNQLTTIVMLEASLRVTCTGSEVVAEVLPHAESDGQAGLDRLASALPDAIRERTATTLRLNLPVRGDNHTATNYEEHERLQAISTLEPLRILANASVDHPHLPLEVGVFAFDYVAAFEPLPRVGKGLNTCPDYLFYDTRIMLVIDHPTKQATLVGVSHDQTALALRLDQIAKALTTVNNRVGVQKLDRSPQVHTRSIGHTKEIHAIPTISDTDFCATVTQMRSHIEAGDIYQVVPSRGFTMPCPDTLGAYRILRDANPSPYMFYLGTPTFELAGASPESSLLYSTAPGKVAIRPIAGTKPRGLTADGSVDHERDTRLELELRTDEKELAEHIMLVDLARNDVARVSTPGTRRVSALMRVDRYSRVMHLVSEVTGELASDLDALDAFRASMTMGTLTGAPKLRAAALIRESEGIRRGSYGGAVGYLRGDGEFDTCIVIRSAFVKDGIALVQSGAGVVHSSVPEMETAETVHKARAVLEAIAKSQGAVLVINQDGEC